MLNFIREWGIFWEYNGLFALLVGIILIISMSIVTKIIDFIGNWRLKNE